MQILTPYLLFLGDVSDQLAAKTGQGIVDWRSEWCLGQLRLPGCKADLRIPDMSIEEAAAKGARTLIVGVVNSGGFMPDAWTATIVEAIEAGLDVASGLHTRLGSKPEIAAAAARHGRQLWDVRHSDLRFETGKGTKRPGMRLLAVGTDCAVGKKYTALALEREMRAQGFDADFRATGQTGIFISGRGVAIDAVVADFISGAAEWISPAASPHHWDVIEGQGSLFHPAFAGVSLGLAAWLAARCLRRLPRAHPPHHARRFASPAANRGRHRPDHTLRRSHQSRHPAGWHFSQYRRPGRKGRARLPEAPGG